MTRSERDYGLPPLTIAEAARVLRIEPSALMNWLATNVKKTPQMWTNWSTGGKLPEAIVRLYLTQEIEGQIAPTRTAPAPRPAVSSADAGDLRRAKKKRAG